MKPQIEFRKMRDFGEIINDTFVFVGENWKSLLKTYAVICGFFIVASLSLSILNQVKMVDAINNVSPNSFKTSPFKIFTVEYFLSMIFMVIAYTSISLISVVYVALYVEKGNEAATVEEVWTRFKFYFFRVLGSAILLGIGICIAFGFCLVPGFYLWPAFSIIIPIMVVENTTLGFAFNRSFELVKGNYWAILGTLVVITIIVYVALLMFTLPISLFTTGSILLSGHKLTKTALILNAVAGHVLMFFYMLPSITVCLIYFSQTEQKDGSGLLERINNLGKVDFGDIEKTDEQY